MPTRSAATRPSGSRRCRGWPIAWSAERRDDMAWPRALQLRRHFQRVVLGRPWLTFVVMGLAFFCFGMVTLNLLHLLRANAELILDNGVMALADGGALQLVELVANGYGAMLAYVVM